MGKRSAVRLGRDILRDVWRHPANENHRVRAVARALRWQLWRRVVRRPYVGHVYGKRIRMRPGSGSCANFAYFGELFEYDQVQLAQHLLRPGDCVVDGGANIGAYTLLFSSLVDGGEIHSFEPVPQAAEWLRDNVALNGLSNVTVHEAALADRPGTLHFTQGSDVANERVPVAGAGTVQTRAETLAVLLDERRVALAKLDLEGGEMAALRGAGKHLAAGNPAVLMVELMDWQLRKQGSTVAEVCDLLRATGYQLFRYDGRVRQLRGLGHTPDRTENDVVAVHVSAMGLLRERGLDVVGP